MSERIDKVERFARIWWKSRYDGGISQEKMALALGVSKKTVQNWEKGVSFPDLFQSTEWFKTLGLNPFHYYLEYFYPDGITSDKLTDGEIDNRLLALVKDLDAEAKEKLFYILAGDYGSSNRGILELITAYCHLPLNDRVSISSIIKDRYEMNESMDKLVEPNRPKPSMSILNNAIDNGRNAVIKGKKAYTIQHNIEEKDTNK